MPEALMAMTTSPGPGVGSGNSRSSSFRLPRKTMPFMSVSFALVDESQERPPRAEPPQVLAERGDDAAGAARRAARGVRRDDHARVRSEEHTSELQSPCNLVCRLLLEKKKKKKDRWCRRQR